MSAKSFPHSANLTREDSLRIFVFDRIGCAAKGFIEARDAYERAVRVRWPGIDQGPVSIKRRILRYELVGEARRAAEWPGEVAGFSGALARLTSAESAMRGFAQQAAVDGRGVFADVATLGTGLASLVRSAFNFRLPSGPRYAFRTACDPALGLMALGILVREAVALSPSSALMARTPEGEVEMLVTLSTRVATQVARELSELVATLHGELLARTDECRSLISQLGSA